METDRPIYQDTTKPEYTASPDNPTKFVDEDAYNKVLKKAIERGDDISDIKKVPVPVLKFK